MQDRYTLFWGVPGDILAEPCSYCAAGAGEIVAADQWPPERLVHLYRCRGLSTYRIAELTGLGRQRVTRALHRAGEALRPRGYGRFRPLRRPDDRPGLPQLIAELHEVARLSSRQIAAITGLPERTVRDRLRRYGIRVRSRGGWNRGPQDGANGDTPWAVPLSAPLVKDLYWYCGAGLSHIELLTGQPAETVRGFTRREGIRYGHRADGPRSCGDGGQGHDRPDDRRTGP
jgi:hypothetical protein